MMRVTHRDRAYTGTWIGVADDVLMELGVPMPTNDKKRAALLSLATEVLLAARLGEAVSYSRRPEAYTRARRYAVAGFTYTHTMSAVATLVAFGLISEGRSLPGSVGKQSTVRATSRLIEAVDDLSTFTRALAETIILKNEAKKYMDYEETTATRAWRTEIHRANEAFRVTRIELPSAFLKSDILTTDDRPFLPWQRHGYRVFNNGDWNDGGRFYGCFWQWLSKELRPNLLIEGEPVDEPDFANLHPQLLGALTGLPLIGDAYNVPGLDRKLAKRAWNIALNAGGRVAATRALADKLGGRHMYYEAAHALNLVIERHAAWSSHFYTGAGLKLQRLDSDILFQVLADCFDDGFCVLPVHDSFVVQRSKADRVREFMDNRLLALLKHLRASA